MDVKQFAHQLKSQEDSARKRKIKLGHVQQAMAAGFGFKTYQGMCAEISVVGRVLTQSDFQKAYFDARLSELLKNESKPAKTVDQKREGLWS